MPATALTCLARPTVSAFALFILLVLPPAAVHAQSEIQQRLRYRVEAGLTTDSFDVMDERIFARETLRRVYPERDFEPICVSEDGLSEQAQQFIRWLETEPARHGLRPEHYHLGAIESIDGDRVGGLVDLELALRDNPSWSRDAIERAIAERREQTVTLPRPIPVHLLYWTVWVDPDGTLEFRDDIYERDVPVLRELREDPPA
jgi:hypothetical protein